VPVLNGGDELAKLDHHLLVGKRRRVVQVRRLELAGLSRAERLDGEGGAVPLVDLVAAGHAHHLARRGGVLDPLHAVPRHGLDHARDIAELQLQECVPVALLATRALAHEEHAVHRLTVGEVADEDLLDAERGLLHEASEGRAGGGRFFAPR
jgi:hypothetical protein